MTNEINDLFEKNIDWAKNISEKDPDFFGKLSKQQSPEYLWIGCADSRVPANEIVGLLPGELFVHRNVANVVVHSDINCLSVIQYAVEVLKVKHIIICGHYGCGGVKAAIENESFGLIDHWLHPIKTIYVKNKERVNQCKSTQERVNLMCEINVEEQVTNVSHTTIIQKAWSAGQKLSIHGWIYGIGDGILRNLDVTVDRIEQVAEEYRMV